MLCSESRSHFAQGGGLIALVGPTRIEELEQQSIKAEHDEPFVVRPVGMQAV